VILKANVVDVATGILSMFPGATPYRSQFYTVYLSLSLSLNVILTLLIVVRLVLHGRGVRAALRTPTGNNGLYKAIATMLIESSALFAVSSLLIIGPWAAASPGSNVFTPILPQTQVRVSPRLRSLEGFSHVTVGRTGHRFTTHYSTSRRQERFDE